MPIIPEPAQGTIIDVQYLSNIIKQLNSFATDYAGKKNSRIATTRDAATLDIATTNLGFAAGRVMVTSDNNNKTKDVIPFTFDFGKTFKHKPIVTATPQASATGLKGNGSNVSIVINNVTTTKIEGSVYFNSEAKQSNIYINIIAVGHPVGV
jgi:hypothetical protein